MNHRNKVFLSLTRSRRWRRKSRKKKMKLFGEQKNRPLDKFKPYQRPDIGEFYCTAQRMLG
jgi:hypothetical protein